MSHPSKLHSFQPNLAMKKSLLIAAILLFSIAASANTVIVKGSVVYPNGEVAQGKWIYITTVKTNNNPNVCITGDSVMTNPNGYFIDSLTCSNSDITVVKLKTLNCDGKWLEKIVEVPTNKVVEVKFEICKPINETCKAQFTRLQLDSNRLVWEFNSSAVIVAAGDEIVQRLWTFGDGTGKSTHDKIVRKEYAQPGTYTVCLKIVTAKGCVSETCMGLTIIAPPTTCKARFEFHKTPTSIFGSTAVNFNSHASIPAQNDVIVKRIWQFGNGDKLDGNEVEPTYSYSKGGRYEVCLTIITQKGCESKICHDVEIPVLSDTGKCKAIFSRQVSTTGKVIFNSKQSYSAIPGDSIIERVWNFDNGRIQMGNIVRPEVEYPVYGGKYKVCLSIRTVKGCINQMCDSIEIKPRVIPADSTKVWLIKLYPNPVSSSLNIVLYSGKPNEQVEVAILDLYGQIKQSIRLVLQKGYNFQTLNTSALPKGSYILRTTSSNIVQSKNFYKIN